MSKLQRIMKSIRHDDEYIYCREAVELIAKETNEEIKEVGRFLASIFFHIEFCDFSYEQYEDTGIFTKFEPSKLDMEEEVIAYRFFEVNKGIFTNYPQTKSKKTEMFIQHLIEYNSCTYYDNFGLEYDFLLYWEKDKFFQLCKHYGLFAGDDSTLNRADSSDMSVPTEASRNLELESENVRLKNNLNATINSGKSVTANMNIIGALLGTLLSEKRFKSQAELKAYLLKQYDGYTGISESNLDNVFSLANQYLKDPK